MSETRKHLSDCVWAGQPLSAAMSCHCTATPPTPDIDAVLARVRGTWMAMMKGHSDAEPFFVIRNDNVKKFADDLRALLSAVTRPAEARGEPEYAEVSDEQIIAHLDSLAALRLNDIGADEWHLAFKRAAYAMRQLRTHLAPSGGEGDLEAALKTAEWWADSDAHGNGVRTLARAFLALARATPAPPEQGEAVGRIRLAVENLASGKYNPADPRDAGWLDAITAVLRVLDAEDARVTPPRPEPGEVSEAMVEAGVEGWIAAINDSHSLARMEHEVSRHEIVGRILRAALAAREPKP